MMDVFYIEFQDKDILTKDETLADGVAVLENITGASTSKFSWGHHFEKLQSQSNFEQKQFLSHFQKFVSEQLFEDPVPKCGPKPKSAFF